jgi:hypothetical protein
VQEYNIQFSNHAQSSLFTMLDKTPYVGLDSRLVEVDSKYSHRNLLGFLV